MTREDAIKTISELKRETNDSWYEEVYGMAIEALNEQRDKIDCKHCVYMNPKICDCDNFVCKK